MNKPIIINSGTHGYRVTDAKWDREKHHALISFEDDNGISFETIGWGTSEAEIRDAVKESISGRIHG